MTEIESAAIWQIVIFMVNGKANHAGLSIPEHGFADLSLLGARVMPWVAPSLPKGDRLFFSVCVLKPVSAMRFVRRPGSLMTPIIKKEKACRGWHLTDEAPGYVRQFHSVRSTDPENMNCVEWVTYGLEVGGVWLPEDVLTPNELLEWCRQNRPEVNNPMFNGEDSQDHGCNEAIRRSD